VFEGGVRAEGRVVRLNHRRRDLGKEQSCMNGKFTEFLQRTSDHINISKIATGEKSGGNFRYFIYM
jgi:hypothetical protein